ncbi:Ribonucleases P/MRP protein subunit pop1 [Erysiphe neolycopersici]|uniref:Ribonucleases P/MRP protein subunit pop1 n=1 Tax=Erysiphe neolycopersici TaxID=212602 RepID=A0A420I275_9PEZI|nr:Ribonucleases P/MRP protein subunit pop1 [Erysiphe neolycopersici]
MVIKQTGAISGLKRPRETSSIDSAKVQKPKTAKKYEKKIDARSIATQSSEAALKNGQLDVEAFLRSREFEIKALQDGMQKAKKNLSKRALQKVPRAMRRRTASHNVKRLPRKLQKRAAKEMKFENTPTINANKRKPRTSRGRLRTETAKKLCLLSAKNKIISRDNDGKNKNISTRLPRPKIRRNQLNQAPILKSKFRKRQITKNWLPTHIWHAKRAKMTEPNNPLWRFAIPITPTEKSYRPTHRAGGLRGAIAWDMSYISTICLEGSELSLEIFLKKIGVTEKWLWEEKGLKWRNGKRSWTGWLSRVVKDKSIFLCPSLILWCPLIHDPKKVETTNTTTTSDVNTDTTTTTAVATTDAATDTTTASSTTKRRFPKKPTRRVFLRIHPSAFLETWTELLRLSKLQRPAVRIQDLRFEIGSIDITGPGSTESLLGILHPYSQIGIDIEKHAETFNSLSRLTNPATLPHDAMLSFSIMDPRLRYPPRTIKIPAANDEENIKFLQSLTEWPVDNFTGASSIFDQETRFRATHLPSQKSINRRKGLAPPGTYPPTEKNDPPIPIVLLASRIDKSTSSQGTWTILAPWKCILPLWYGLVHYPLSTGGNPRFGGLQELQQIHFEHGSPCFPMDYLGTSSGFSWEIQERLKKKSEWDKKPKGKRIEWSSLDLGNGRIGEVGRGWSCDFEYLLQPKKSKDKEENSNNEGKEKIDGLPFLDFLQSSDLNKALLSKSLAPPSSNTVSTVRIKLVGRGVARYAARIYRLPRAELSSDSPNTDSTITIRDQWLSLLPANNKTSNSSSRKYTGAKSAKRQIGRIPVNTPLPHRVRLLAQSLLQQPPSLFPNDAEHDKLRRKNDPFDHPLIPNVEDLIGFVTTGEYCLVDGKATAIGNILACKVLDDFYPNHFNLKQSNPPEKTRSCKSFKNFVANKYARLCIVRNSGEAIGRLAFWEPI